jgi:acyl transferase domain-containing protein
MADGDRVRGVILGTGVNSSGSVAPVNAPVDSAQEDAMRRAFQMANRSPRDVSFLELHATGTARGDPTEANWIGRAFKRDGDILIGSVKGNIG